MEITVERSPPCASLCPREIREDAGTGPHASRVDGAVRVLDEVIASDAAVIGRIILMRQICDVQIGNHDDMKVFRFEFRDHACKVGKALAVDGEWPFLFLEVDIKIDGVRRNVIGPETICDFKHPRLRIVSVTGLLEAEHPHGRQWRLAPKPPKQLK